MLNDTLLRVENLVMHFKTQKGSVRAVDGVFFNLAHKEAVGHSVRYAYLNTAAAMLARDDDDTSLRDHLAEVWQRMVSCSPTSTQQAFAPTLGCRLCSAHFPRCPVGRL